MIFRTRFAPSPTGPLHLGHAYSALLAHDMAAAAGGVFHLRIDDIDQSRARPHWEAQIHDNLHWLGITWPEPVWRQSERSGHYREALQRLWDKGLMYACNCTRRDILAAANAPQEGAPLQGPDGVIYPGTCRRRPRPAQIPDGEVLRLDMKLAMKHVEKLTFTEKGESITATTNDMARTVGDVVLSRRDMAAAYHLAIVVDDADQAITHVIRGEDLRDATRIHVLLQHLLGFPVPAYHHHRLIRDEAGRRLAKRDDARAIATYRAEGLTPQDIRKMVGIETES